MTYYASPRTPWLASVILTTDFQFYPQRSGAVDAVFPATGRGSTTALSRQRERARCRVRCVALDPLAADNSSSRAACRGFSSSRDGVWHSSRRCWRSCRWPSPPWSGRWWPTRGAAAARREQHRRAVCATFHAAACVRRRPPLTTAADGWSSPIHADARHTDPFTLRCSATLTALVRRLRTPSAPRVPLCSPTAPAV